MKQKALAAVFSVLILLCLTVQSTPAATIDWVDWTSATPGTPNVAVGTLTGNSVVYTGDIDFSRTQTSGGTNYWVPDTPYLSATVENAPATSDIVVLSAAGIVNTITFATAVVDPVMAIVSLGRDWSPNWYVNYTFSAPFEILSSGTGWWGGAVPSLFQLAPNVLQGQEGHGAIQFHGTFSSLSWVADPAEYWHGFTFGVPQGVPEPASFMLVSAGLVGAGLFRKKLKK